MERNTVFKWLNVEILFRERFLMMHLDFNNKPCSPQVTFLRSDVFLMILFCLSYSTLMTRLFYLSKLRCVASGKVWKRRFSSRFRHTSHISVRVGALLPGWDPKRGRFSLPPDLQQFTQRWSSLNLESTVPSATATSWISCQSNVTPANPSSATTTSCTTPIPVPSSTPKMFRYVDQ